MLNFRLVHLEDRAVRCFIFKLGSLNVSATVYSFFFLLLFFFKFFLHFLDIIKAKNIVYCEKMYEELVLHVLRDCVQRPLLSSLSS